MVRHAMPNIEMVRHVRIMHARVIHIMIWHVRGMNIWANISEQGSMGNA
jgi:hypothetical protein